MSECVFCMIAAGKMPAKVVYEDDDIIAFDDIMPQSPVHTLVVPREHYASLNDGIPADLLGKVFSVVAKVAEIKGVDKTGYRAIVNNGKDASQSVDHVHVHVLGGKVMSHGMVRFFEDDES